MPPRTGTQKKLREIEKKREGNFRGSKESKGGTKKQKKTRTENAGQRASYRKRNNVGRREGGGGELEQKKLQKKSPNKTAAGSHHPPRAPKQTPQPKGREPQKTQHPPATKETTKKTATHTQPHTTPTQHSEAPTRRPPGQPAAKTTTREKTRKQRTPSPKQTPAKQTKSKNPPPQRTHNQPPEPKSPRASPKINHAPAQDTPHPDTPNRHTKIKNVNTPQQKPAKKNPCHNTAHPHQKGRPNPSNPLAPRRGKPTQTESDEKRLPARPATTRHPKTKPKKPPAEKNTTPRPPRARKKRTRSRTCILHKNQRRVTSFLKGGDRTGINGPLGKRKWTEKKKNKIQERERGYTTLLTRWNTNPTAGKNAEESCTTG